MQSELNSKKRARWLRPLGFLLFFFLLLLAFCGVFKTQYASWMYESFGNDIIKPDFRDDTFLYDLADRFGLMAHLAQVVYRDDLQGHLESACSYLSPEIELPEYGMPELSSSDASLSGETEKVGRWSRWRGSKNVTSAPCYNRNGLFYETYVYIAGSTIVEAVIAFRGTENSGSQFWQDWSTNLANSFGIEPKQYEIAAGEIPSVIAALKSENPDVAIYATGHSLGGGLAQQTGYLSKDIKEVFTFNTSPVTNWTNLALRGKVQKAYPIFHRIYNGGEALGGIRNISTLFTKARYGRHDIGIQVKPKEIIKGHSMTLLSCHFACLIENRNKIAEHNFSPNYIRSNLMGKDGICKDYVDFGRCELSN